MIRLRGITWNHTRGYDPMVATAAAFQREHPQVEIVWEKRSLHDFDNAPVDQLAQQYDLVVLDHPWVGFIHETQSYVPLNDFLSAEALDELAKNSAGPSHASYQWAGRQWALAIDAATPSASYRPDLLDRLNANVPQTWDEVLELGRRCRQLGMTVGLPLSAVGTITAFLSLADNLGGALFTQPGRVVDHEIGQRVLNSLRAVVELSTYEFFEMNPISMMDRMSSTDQIVYCPLAYSYNNYARPGYRRHLCHYANMPGINSADPRGSHLGGTGLAISRRCQTPKIAAEYALRVAGGEWQKTIYFAAGGQPAHLAAWDDKDVNARCSNFFLDTRRTIDLAFLRPRYHGYIRFQYEGGSMISKYLQCGGQSSDLLTKLDELYHATLQHAQVK